MSFTMTLTAAQREALQLAVTAAQIEWRNRARVLAHAGLPALSDMAAEIHARIAVLSTLTPILYRPTEPAPIDPAADDKYSCLRDDARAEQRELARAMEALA